jgi:hypothetical protein
MNKATAEMIGEKVGEWIEADVGEDDFAAGEYLRIKVRINIMKPLMRGMMIQLGEEGRNKWCPFRYEFLSEFCYNCGIIGHDEKSCLRPINRAVVTDGSGAMKAAVEVESVLLAFWKKGVP